MFILTWLFSMAVLVVFGPFLVLLGIIVAWTKSIMSHESVGQLQSTPKKFSTSVHLIPLKEFFMAESAPK